MKYAEGGKRRRLPEKLVARAPSPVAGGEGKTFQKWPAGDLRTAALPSDRLPEL